VRPQPKAVEGPPVENVASLGSEMEYGLEYGLASVTPRSLHLAAVPTRANSSPRFGHKPTPSAQIPPKRPEIRGIREERGVRETPRRFRSTMSKNECAE
jgi:hypothetical protein